MSLEPSLPNQPLPAPRARAREPFVLWFDAIGRDATPRVGAKGANLGEMMRAGLPVTPGFVVTAAASRDSLEKSGIEDEIERRLRDVAVDDIVALQHASEALQSRIRNASMVEDAAKASFAGMLA